MKHCRKMAVIPLLLLKSSCPTLCKDCYGCETQWDEMFRKEKRKKAENKKEKPSRCGALTPFSFKWQLKKSNIGDKLATPPFSRKPLLRRRASDASSAAIYKSLRRSSQIHSLRFVEEARSQMSALTRYNVREPRFVWDGNVLQVGAHELLNCEIQVKWHLNERR